MSSKDVSAQDKVQIWRLIMTVDAMHLRTGDSVTGRVVVVVAGLVVHDLTAVACCDYQTMMSEHSVIQGTGSSGAATLKFCVLANMVVFDV